MAEDKKPPAKPVRKAIVDTSIIGEERIQQLRAKAAKKVELERQQAAEAQLLEQFEREERQAGGLDEPTVSVSIDLAPYADRLMLDGVIYFQGRTVEVRQSVADVIHEMMHRTWQHQSIVDGKSENFYRQTRGQAVTPSGVVSNILRA